MRLILAALFLLTVSRTPTTRLYLPTLLREMPRTVSALGPCTAELDCIQGYP